jgi:hypothetical protein
MNIKIVTNTKELPSKVDLYAIPIPAPNEHEKALAHLNHVAVLKGRILGDLVYQWGNYWFGQLLEKQPQGK